MDPETGKKIDESVPQEGPIVAPALNKENNDDEEVVTYDEEDRRWAMIVHIASLCGLVIPFGGIICPMAIWKRKEDRPFVVRHAKEALEFQINILVLSLFALMLVFVFLGVLILPLLAIANVVLAVVAGMRAKEGKHYEYPWIVRVVGHYKFPTRASKEEEELPAAKN